MKKIILAICLLVSLSVQAQKQAVEAYINTYKELAITEMLRTGVPASIKLAQGILESQSGESDLAKKSNNHFGIKCKTEWTGDKTYHDDDERGECFRVYPSVADSYKDHSDFLRSRPHYAFLFQINPTNAEAWAKGLKKAGYATSSTYPQRLLKVINDYHLQQYSLLALARKENDKDNQTTIISVTTKTTPSDNGNTGNPVSYPSGIFSINHSKVIYGMKGSSLLSLAIQYDIPLSKLLEYNDLPEMDVLDTDRLIFIEKKLKKGAVVFHLVQPGETLHAISQQEGIRLDSILDYNRLNRTANVLPGDKLYLQPVSGILTQPSKYPK